MEMGLATSIQVDNTRRTTSGTEVTEEKEGVYKRKRGPDVECGHDSVSVADEKVILIQ
jgi:hypothetical protein